MDRDIIFDLRGGFGVVRKVNILKVPDSRRAAPVVSAIGNCLFWFLEKFRERNILTILN